MIQHCYLLSPYPIQITLEYFFLTDIILHDQFRPDRNAALQT